MPNVKRKLTKSFVDALGPEDRDYVAWDTEIPAFGVKVTPKGRKVFLILYRPKGSPKAVKATMGAYGALTIEQARDQGRQIVAAALRGENPHAEARVALQRFRSDRFDELVEQHISEHVAQFRR